ncbi:MAG: hypothetical protein QHH15_07275, partial [Candidatus Thermoplasmatota archaeon]|nr:hypothetical protein [Candidatus Thermoplasmatota archaeon]
MFKKSSKDKLMFKPYNVDFIDDAVHLKDNFSDIETWYFDANLKRDYSVVVLVNLFHVNSLGFVLTSFFLYKDSKLIKMTREKYSLKEFYGLIEYPVIKINNKTIINYLGCDKKTGFWSYNISTGDKVNGVDLCFVQKNKSWKGKTLLGKWLVIPVFDVYGSIFIDGKKMDVKGIGYHDHNIYPLYAPFFVKGYYFGKIPIDEINITWAEVISRKGVNQQIIVINKNDSYFSIKPDKIRFEIEKEIKYDKKIIPEIFNINLDTDNVNLSVECKMKNVHDIHFPFLNYW